MHVLFVTPMLPSTAGGSRSRTFNLIKCLSPRHSVSVISFAQPSDPDVLSELLPYCRHVELVHIDDFVPMGKWRNRLEGWWRLLTDPRPQYVRTFPVERMGRPLKRLARSLDVDVVQFQHLHMAELLPAVGGLPAVLDEHNVESEIAGRRLALGRNPVHRLRDTLTWKKLVAFETRWVQRFPVCLAVSERDARALSAMAGNAGVFVVPNGVDSGYFSCENEPAVQRRSGLVFAGTMNYEPNVDGALFFCHEILPLIRRSLPDVTLAVVGAKPVPEVLALNSLPGVQVTGYVDDVRPYFWHASVSVVPLRVGGGTRFKILESLAAGCPVVSTTIGAEGLDLSPGRDLLVADRPDDFAAGVVQLLADPAQLERLALAGRERVVGLYDWGLIAGKLEEAYQSAMARKGSNASS